MKTKRFARQFLLALSLLMLPAGFAAAHARPPHSSGNVDGRSGRRLRVSSAGARKCGMRDCAAAASHVIPAKSMSDVGTTARTTRVRWLRCISRSED